MNYIYFCIGFTVIHTISYIIAGVVSLKLSPELYKERERLFDFLRDLSRDSERNHVEKWFLPAQILRGILLSIVLLPILDILGGVSVLVRIVFLSALMFIYTDAASATPFPHNIEGLVYIKAKYLSVKSAGRLYLETLIYSSLFGSIAGVVLFL